MPGKNLAGPVFILVEEQIDPQESCASEQKCLALIWYIVMLPDAAHQQAREGSHSRCCLCALSSL